MRNYEVLILFMVVVLGHIAGNPLPTFNSIPVNGLSKLPDEVYDEQVEVPVHLVKRSLLDRLRIYNFYNEMFRDVHLEQDFKDQQKIGDLKMKYRINKILSSTRRNVLKLMGEEFIRQQKMLHEIKENAKRPLPKEEEEEDCENDYEE